MTDYTELAAESPQAMGPAVRWELRDSHGKWNWCPRQVYEDAIRDGTGDVRALGVIEPVRELTEEQWYDIAAAHANCDWNWDGYLDAIKSVGKAVLAAATNLKDMQA